jgi:uncharacterized protein DUF2694
MNDQPDPDFDTIHPSGGILFRSCRGGALHSVTLNEDVMNTDAASLAEAILLTASVSALKATMEIRAEIIAAQPADGASSSVPTRTDLDQAIKTLNAHTLPYRHDH